MNSQPTKCHWQYSTEYWNATKLKISVIGNMAVGKTCLALRFAKNTFEEKHRVTISDIETKAVKIDDKNVVFQIWDTAGQERFRSLLPLYMKGIDGALVVYDVTDKDTFRSVETWVQEVRKYSTDGTVIVVVGNKVDLADASPDKRQVDEQEAGKFCRERGLMFMESSAMTGHNVDDIFMELGTWCNIVKQRREAPPTNQNGLVVSSHVSPQKRRCCR